MTQEAPQSPRTALVTSVKRVYSGFLSIDEASITYNRYDGTQQTVTRQSMERGDAAAVLAVDWNVGHVILVEQFRYPTLKGGPGWVVETPAGMIDALESPEEAARRETFEETGVRPLSIERIGQFYVSPGGTSERIFLFYADVSNRAHDLAGAKAAQDPDEDILLVETSVEAFIQDALMGRIDDAKTLIAGLWLATNRKRLQP